MILIADSGSTKTTWSTTSSENKLVTEGLNPHFTSDEAFLEVCAAVRKHFSFPATRRSSVPTGKHQLFFYGAGCGNTTQRKRVLNLLAQSFESTDIYVETDMLGACRAVSGHEAGYVGILGTGSNACYYDGTAIKCQPTSTGYILGDEGSANHVGRMLLNSYLTHRMPARTRKMFHDKFRYSDAQLVDAVYHQPNANRFLATLAPFAVQHLEDDVFCSDVIQTALLDWYNNCISTLQRRVRYHDEPLNIVGGFAKAIEPTLRKKFDTIGLCIGTIVADPMDGLTAFHSS